MQKKLLLITFILILRLIILSDIQIIQEVKTEELDTKSGIRTLTTSKQIKWIKKNKLAIINNDFKSIINLSESKEKNKFIFIDNINKTFFKTSFPLFFSKLLPKELTAVRINQLPRVKVKELSFKEKIGKYNCKIHKITLNFMMMIIKIKIWSSEDLFKNPMISETDNVNNLNSNFFLKYFYPDLPEKEKGKRSFYYKLKKIKGFWIRSEVEMDLLIRKIKIITELKNILYKEAPPKTFSIPENYIEKTN